MSKQLLNTVEVERARVDVFVNTDGKFTADFHGEIYASETLDGLKRDLRDAVKAQRLEVPFVSITGQRGTMRGYHASQRKILVTWDDGEKGTLDHHNRVFPADVDEALIAEIQVLDTTLENAKQRKFEIGQSASTASDLFSAAFGEDVDDWKRNR